MKNPHKCESCFLYYSHELHYLCIECILADLKKFCAEKKNTKMSK